MRYLFILLCTYCALAAPMRAQQLDPNAPTARERKATQNVVFVSTGCKYDTGFYTGRCYSESSCEVVTRYHLIDPDRDGTYNGTGECGDEVKVDGLPATILDRSLEKDMLVLAAPVRKGRTLNLLAFRSYATPSEAVFSVGFGGGIPNVFARGTIYENVTPCLITVELNITSGASGSPIIALKDGAVLASAQGDAHKVYISEGIEMFRRYTLATSGRCIAEHLQAVRAKHPVLPVSPNAATARPAASRLGP